MVIVLINDQLDRVEESLGNVKVSALLLVGGFGSSEYLRQEIKNHFNGEDDIPELRVIQPVNAYVYPT
jgi:tRNA A37 threonylcarbamoyltransferase TsaD